MLVKWGAVYNLQKILGFSMIALLVAAPSVGFASSMLTSQDYVDLQDNLKVDKNWGVGTNNSNVGKALVVGNSGIVELGDAVGDANVIEHVQANGSELSISNKTVNIPVMGAAAAGTAGTVGLVPASSAGDQDKFLKANGTWAVATASVMTGANGTNAGTSGLVPAPTATDNTKFLRGDGTWAEDNNTTYSAMTGADGTNSGTSGLVPAPAATDNTKFLRGDGTWAEDNNTTYSAMTGADGTNSGTSGLVPAPAATDNTKFLKGDGTWAEVDALPVGSAANQMLQYNSTNSTWDVVSIDTTPTSGHTVPVTSGGVYDVVNNKQTKPSSGVANGKVLTYTGSDVDTQVSAAYVTLPVATGAPSTNTPSSFAEVWIQ